MQTEDRLRSRDILKIFSARSLWRLSRGMVRATFDPRFAGHPLAVCWFTNFSCNARCAFCCKAAEVRAGHDRFPPLSLDGAKELLLRIRRSVDMLYISGGEPTLHPHIEEIAEEARRLRFRSVGMTSNLINLADKKELLNRLHAVCCSLHGSTPERHAQQLGLPVSAGERVFENLELMREARQRNGLRIMVNCVVGEENADDVDEMLDFTRKRGFLVEFVPANDHGDIPKRLQGNPKYVGAINKLLDSRRKGLAPHLAGSSHYYRTIRDFSSFRCFPYGVPNITPDGRLCTPCDVSEQYGVSVLDYPDLKSAVRASLGMLGEYPCRTGKCFKSGIIERSHLYGLLAAELRDVE